MPTRRVALAPPGGGRTQTSASGFVGQQIVSSAKFINDAAPRPAAYQLRPVNHTPKLHVPYKTPTGGQTRAALTMAGPNFHTRRDRGWRRGWPFRFFDIKQDIDGVGYRGVGNIHTDQGMSPPRMLLGLLPGQTSNWQPYQYPLNGG